MSRYIKTVYVEKEVDIYSDDLSDEDVRELCEERGIKAGGADSDEVTEMFYAFKLGRQERAMELARKIAQDHVGGILP